MNITVSLTKEELIEIVGKYLGSKVDDVQIMTTDDHQKKVFIPEGDFKRLVEVLTSANVIVADKVNSNNKAVGIGIIRSFYGSFGYACSLNTAKNIIDNWGEVLKHGCRGIPIKNILDNYNYVKGAKE